MLYSLIKNKNKSKKMKNEVFGLLIHGDITAYLYMHYIRPLEGWTKWFIWGDICRQHAVIA